jgi:cellulose synthase/poly-beta-1,6-N-acetylglucosamine synthase-like glycosyltransferase
MEVTPEELADLKRARGGYETVDGSPEGLRFEKLDEKGLVKVSVLGDGITTWKLSGDGLRLAYADEP